MKRFKELLHNSRNNTIFIYIGLTLIAIGIALWLDTTYFFFPPQWNAVMNDNGLDGVAVACGLGLIFYAFDETKNRKVRGILLGYASAFVGLMVLMELWHATLAGETRMIPTIIFEIFFIVVIFYEAWRR